MIKKLVTDKQLEVDAKIAEHTTFCDWYELTQQIILSGGNYQKASEELAKIGAQVNPETLRRWVRRRDRMNRKLREIQGVAR